MNKRIISITIMFLALISCVEEMGIEGGAMEDYNNMVTDDLLKVSVEQIDLVSNIFWGKTSESRSLDNNKIIQNIETVYDDNRKSLFYIVNYKDKKGYLIVSATKRYHPILAYSDEGELNINYLSDEARIWLSNRKKISCDSFHKPRFSHIS